MGRKFAAGNRGARGAERDRAVIFTQCKWSRDTTIDLKGTNTATFHQTRLQAMLPPAHVSRGRKPSFRVAQPLAVQTARRLVLLLALGGAAMIPAAPLLAQHLVNALSIPGEAVDLHPGQGANQNRLGGFGSDLVFVPDPSRPHSGNWYGLVDRGPGGGVLPYEARVQQFQLDVDLDSGRISNFALQATIVLALTEKTLLDGQNPQRLGGTDQLRHSLDAEGLAGGAGGVWFVADEYGPTVRRFCSEHPANCGGPSARSRWLSQQLFETPKNLLPIDELGSANYIAEPNGHPNLSSGRRPNRGFEGLTLSPGGNKLFAILQSPLVNEGPQDDGDRGRYVRIVEFDVQTGASSRQMLYELESVATINDRIADEQGHFKRSKQGRSIGASSLLALDDQRLLVLERDNRGIGIDNPANADPVLRFVGSKRLYEIDLSQASDVSQLSLRGQETLPAGVRPVAKRLFLDMQAEAAAHGLPLPEKFEGVAIGPRLNDGSYLLVVATDNDFSVTQTSSTVQFDIYTDGTQGPVDGPAQGRSLLPSWLYAFKTPLPAPK